MAKSPAAIIYNSAGTEQILATEAKLEAVRVLIEALGAEDFASEATLDAFLTAFNAEDFASQTTLAALLAAFSAEDFSTETTLAAFKASFEAEDFATQTTLATRASEATLAAIKDTAGIKKITDPLPAGTNEIGKVAQGTKASLVNAWPVVATDAAGNAISSQNDAGTRRLEISGKVSITGASPPPATNAATITADTPLTVSDDDTIFVIPNGQTYFLQEMICGNEDPTKGAVITVIYKNATEHVVARQYTAGFTIPIGFPNRGKARDGTDMVGNAGGTFTIIVRRTKYSGSAIAIDAVVRGYTV